MDGRLLRNHFSATAMIVLNSMTQPAILLQVTIVFSRLSVAVILLADLSRHVARLLPGRSDPTITAERICPNQSSQHSRISFSIPPIIPNIKLGPALLQNPNSRCASVFDRVPSVYAPATHCAPTGYPPHRPSSSRLPLPSGMPHSFSTGWKSVVLLPVRPLLPIILRKIKGNSDGTTTERANSTPSAAPSIKI